MRNNPSDYIRLKPIDEWVTVTITRTFILFIIDVHVSDYKNPLF